MRARFSQADIYIWCLVLLFWAGSAIAFFSSRFEVEAAPALAIVLPLFAGSALCIVTLVHRPELKLGRIAGTMLQHSLCAMATAMLAYAAARLNTPLIDAQLLQFDQALGYDWRAFSSFVVAHPSIEGVLQTAYASLFWQPVLIALILPFDSDRLRLNRFVLAHVTVMLLTVLVFALWPATTAWAHLGVALSDVRAQHLQQSAGWTDTLIALRAGGASLVSPQSNFAIIGFPSYHCAAAILNAYAFWTNRWLRYPALALNLVMIASTPLMGGHYIADIIGACIVTSMAILFARWHMAERKPAAVTTRGQGEFALA